MSDRSSVLVETLLRLHGESEVRPLLASLVNRMAPAHGSVLACCYLLDAAREEYVLEAFAHAGGDDPPVPPTVAEATAVEQFGGAAPAGHIAHLVSPPFAPLRRIWGGTAKEYLGQIPQLRGAVIAPILRGEELAGIVILLVGEGWAAATAAECAMHAAVALGGIVERRERADTTAELFMRGVMEQVAGREITRAERYKRALSLAVFELGDDAGEEQGVALSALIARLMRQPDVAGHLDGRRMAVLLPETAASGAAGFIRRLRKQAPPALANLRAVAVSFPQDGRAWPSLVEAAIEQLATPVALRTAIPDSVPVSGAPAEAEANDSTVRVYVNPLAEDEVSRWHALLGRAAVIDSVTLGSYDGRTATYDLHAGSPSRVLAHLRGLAKTMNATYNLMLTGEVGLSLRAGDAGNGRALPPELSGLGAG